MVQEWHNRWTEAELDQATVDMESKAMATKLQKYNVEHLGDIHTEREDGTMRVLVSQMGGCASKEIREIKMAATEKLFRALDKSLRLHGT